MARQRSVLVLLVLLSPGLAAALPSGDPGAAMRLWSTRLGAGEAWGVAPALDGGAFVIGTAGEGGLLTRVGADGAPAWGVREENVAWLGAAALVDGSPVVAGADHAGSASLPLLALYDADGVLQWRATLPGAGILRGVAAGPRGIAAAGDAGHNVLVARWANDGSLQWKRVFGGVLEDHGAAVSVAPDESAYVVGWSYDGLRNRMTAWHLDPAGKLLWQRTVAWPGGSMRAYAASADAQGVLIAGAVASGPLNMPFLARFTSGGTQAWLQTYPGLEGQGASGVVVDPAGGGGVLVGTAAPGHGFLVRVDPAGRPLWSQQLDATEGSAAHAVARDALGVLVAGTIQGQAVVQRALDVPLRPA